MVCINCGLENNKLLCECCLTEPVLEKVINEIRDYGKQICENEYIVEYVSAFNEPKDACICIPEIANYFDKETAEYFTCLYYKCIKNERFEITAIDYLENHSEWDKKKQRILYELLDFYLRSDFEKPQKWCEFIKTTDNLYCELYYQAAQFFAMVGDYSFSDEIILKALNYCNDGTYNNYMFNSKEQELANFEKLAATILNYKTKKPYWPNTEERRRLIAAIYEQKGIKFPRITLKTKKVEECDFQPISISDNDIHQNYSAFWCAETFVKHEAKGIYQIAACKVQNGRIVDEFQSFIKPADGGDKSKEYAAKEVGVDVCIIKDAHDIDEVMPIFFNFVGEDVLISTGALGKQSKLISRAARYTGLNKIENLFFDLLDYAADLSPDYDLQNNTREYLLEHFNLTEGRDSLAKARRNVEIYNYLSKLGESNEAH